MRKFRFRLQKVLEYRQTLEEKAKEAFLEARKQRLGAEAGIDHIHERRMSLLLKGAKSLEARLALELALVRTDDDERAQRAAIAVLADEEEQALVHWTHRRQDVEALNKLRDKALAEWTLESSRKEQSAMDEWAVQRRPA
jgi:flagellar protein FliJ